VRIGGGSEVTESASRWKEFCSARQARAKDVQSMQIGQFNAKKKVKLPDSILGRIEYALIGLFFMPLSSFVMYAMLFLFVKPTSVLGWICYFAFEIIFSSLFVVSTTCLIWAIAKPKWVESIHERFFNKLAISVGICGSIGMPILLWEFLKAVRMGF
jgi:hypothetical protein